ncbi:MAG: hypothetical protein PUQ00_30550 [Nostoc sp. S13]|nr:hypothetical protein [Nostoc sp. S13]
MIKSNLDTFAPFADQPAWREKLAQLGVGITPITYKKLQTSALGDAIQVVVRDTYLCFISLGTGHKYHNIIPWLDYTLSS